MSEGPARSRRQFTLLTVFVVVTEVCLALAGLRLLERDERESLLIAVALIGIGYGLYCAVRWLFSKNPLS